MLQTQRATPLSRLKTKEKVVELQKMCAVLPQIDFEKHTQHFFGGGIYARMLFRPKGSLVIGKVHKKEHMYMVMQGSVLVTTEGEPIQHDGPCIIVCKPGTKRAVLALTDATCVLVVKTDKTELNDELEDELVEHEDGARFDIHNRVIPLKIEGNK